MHETPRRDPAETPPWCNETKKVKTLSAFQHALGFSSGTIHVPNKAYVKMVLTKGDRTDFDS